MILSKSFLLLFFILLSIGQLSAKNYSVEEIQIIKDAFNHPHVLIASQIEKLNPKNIITNNFDTLSLAIYLSNINELRFEIWANSHLYTPVTFTPISKKEILNLATFQEIAAIQKVNSGLYAQAIEKYQQSLWYYTKLKNVAKTAFIKANLSNLYLLKQDLTLATQYNFLATLDFDKLNNQSQKLNCSLKQAHLLLLQGAHTQAESLILKQTLPFYANINSKEKEQQCYFLLGKIYWKSKKQTQAKWFFIQALSLAEKQHLQKARIAALLMLAKVKNDKKDYQLALLDLKQAEKLLNKDLMLYEIDLNLEMAQTYNYLYQQQKANYYHSNFQNLKQKFLPN